MILLDAFAAFVYPLYAGVVKVYQYMFDAGAATVKVTIDEVGPLDANIGMAYEFCHFLMYKSDGSLLFDGKYVFNVYKINLEHF